MLVKKNELYEYQQFLPYLDESIIRQAVKGYDGKFNFAHYYIPYYKYLSEKDLCTIGYDEYFCKKHYDELKYKGYKGGNLVWDEKFDQYKRKNRFGKNLNINQINLHLFNEFLLFCKMNHIKVILVYLPEYYEAQLLWLNRDFVLKLYREYAERYGFIFFDYSNDTICRQKKFFYNSQHLNKIGSEHFSFKLASDLKSVLYTDSIK